MRKDMRKSMRKGMRKGIEKLLKYSNFSKCLFP